MDSQLDVKARTLRGCTDDLMEPVFGHRRWLFGLSFLLLLPVCVNAGEDESFTESVVIFNTVCAKCHEGECSNRLSFENSPEAAASHILRHYPQATGKQWLQRELFVILAYMKEKCAYYPMHASIPADRVWDGSLLDRMTTTPERSYFVPLGPLSPGGYHIGLEFDQDVKLTIQLVSENFEMVVEEYFSASDRHLDIPFSIKGPGNYYFRMYPQESARIIRLAITATGNGVDHP